ncbi:MAG: hypothetical protein LBC99_00565 [Spirochaetota bacterium]|jgi:hypothetical protein|nr:hypothetical protein [Spirochaetota bacterium]
MKRLALPVFLILLCVLPLGAADSALQRYITKDCVVFVQLEKFPEIVKEIESYAVRYGLGLSKGQLDMLISMQLTGRTGYPGFDLSRPTGVFLLKSQDESEGFVVMVPVTDPNTLRNFLSQQGVFDGADAQKVRYRDRYLIVASDADAMTLFEKGAKKTIAKLPDAHIAVFIDGAFLKNSADDIGSMIDGNSNAINQLARKFHSGFIGGIQEMSFGFSFTPQGIEFISAVEVQPESAYSALLKSASRGEPALVAKMPADSYFVTGAKMELKWIESSFGEILVGFYDEFARGLGGVLADAMKEAADIYGDDFACALVPGGEGAFAMVAAMKLAPGKDSKALMAKYTDRINALPALKNIQGRIVYTQNAGRMGADSYDLVRFESGAPQNFRGSARNLDKLLDSLTAYIVTKNGVEYMAIGTGAQSRLADLVGGTKSGFSSTAAWKAIGQNYGQYAKNGVSYISIGDTIKEIVRIVSAYDIGGNEVKSAVNKLRRIPAGGGIYGISQLAQNSMTGSALITKAEIDVLYNLFRSFSGK